MNRESAADELTIAISYMLMFLYIAFTLGQLHLTRPLLNLVSDHTRSVNVCQDTPLLSLSMKFYMNGLYGFSIMCIQVSPILCCRAHFTFLLFL